MFFCIIFIVPILKLGASDNPLKLFPNIPSTNLRGNKYLICPRDTKPSFIPIKIIS